MTPRLIKMVLTVLALAVAWSTLGPHVLAQAAERHPVPTLTVAVVVDPTPTASSVRWSQFARTAAHLFNSLRPGEELVVFTAGSKAQGPWLTQLRGDESDARKLLEHLWDKEVSAHADKRQDAVAGLTAAELLVADRVHQGGAGAIVLLISDIDKKSAEAIWNRAVVLQQRRCPLIIAGPADTEGLLKAAGGAGLLRFDLLAGAEPDRWPLRPSAPTNSHVAAGADAGVAPQAPQCAVIHAADGERTVSNAEKRESESLAQLKVMEDALHTKKKELDRMEEQLRQGHELLAAVTARRDSVQRELAQLRNQRAQVNAAIKELSSAVGMSQNEKAEIERVLSEKHAALRDIEIRMAREQASLAGLRLQEQTLLSSDPSATVSAAASQAALATQQAADEVAPPAPSQYGPEVNAATQPSSAAQTGTPTAPPPGGGHVSPLAVPIIGGIVALLAAAAGAAMYFTRKPPVYAFTLLDEATKAQHRIQMTVGERVDLNGSPTKKAGTASGHAPYLTIDRKGRLMLHPVAGHPTKLNDRLVSTTDSPTIKPGTVLEITTNGNVSRLVVGPVSALNRNRKLSAKSLMASFRPA
jgi:hypothetical protein